MKGPRLEEAPSDAEEKEYLHYQLYLHSPHNQDKDVCVMCWLHPSKIDIKSMRRVAGGLFGIAPHRVSLSFCTGPYSYTMKNLTNCSEMFSGAHLFVHNNPYKGGFVFAPLTPGKPYEGGGFVFGSTGILGTCEVERLDELARLAGLDEVD
uniref:Uncharacterized protein n=1 Tax=Pithovirus LCPAC304 TaxID=2506594 RepID=A0A481ZB45_9VIRU|nr:MAG: hypothetical protein LCPAC304_06460 [Pithovirus LCPAC304]